MKTVDKKVDNNPKPVQEGKPSAQQKPMGDKADLERNEEYKKGDQADDVNNVGIAKKKNKYL
jgi:hypothetical protein